MVPYTFGDDSSAVERLALVAAAYESASRAFLTASGPRDASLAVDLGCGPGFSTVLLGEILTPRRLVGLDSSPEFLDRTRMPDAEFAVQDVSAAALPGDAEVLYARLLLAHLADPLAVAGRWRDQLGPAGVLLIEDLEDIDAPAGPLRTYDGVSAAVVRHGGGLMYAGRVLAALGGDCTPVTVPAALAASIYLFNVRRWKGSPPPGTSYDEIAELETALLVTAQSSSGTVSWIVRQIAIRA